MTNKQGIIFSRVQYANCTQPYPLYSSSSSSRRPHLGARPVVLLGCRPSPSIAAPGECATIGRRPTLPPSGRCSGCYLRPTAHLSSSRKAFRRPHLRPWPSGGHTITCATTSLPSRRGRPRPTSDRPPQAAAGEGGKGGGARRCWSRRWCGVRAEEGAREGKRWAVGSPTGGGRK
jgi:hypothetical protein